MYVVALLDHRMCAEQCEGIYLITSGWLGGYFGRKKIIQLTVPFAIVGWIILGTAENRISLFSGRIVTSIALMCQMSAPSKTHKI